MERMVDVIVKPVAGEGLELCRVPVPDPDPGETLIKIHMSAVRNSGVRISSR